MTTRQSALHGIRTSADYFISTFLFGVMFGIAAVAAGMSMTHHFDGHSLSRRIVWLALLNDPGVVNSFRMDAEVDRLGYVTGYGISMMISWLLSTYIGLNVAHLFTSFDLGAIDFAGPLVIATMMMLFFKGSTSKPTPWILSGVVALILFEVGAANYVILLGSVLVGMVVAILQSRNSAAGANDG